MLFSPKMFFCRHGGPYERRGQTEHPQDARPGDPPRSQSRCRERHGASRSPERVQERKPMAIPAAGRRAIRRTDEEAGAPGVTRTPGQRCRTNAGDSYSHGNPPLGRPWAMRSLSNGFRRRVGVDFYFLGCFTSHSRIICWAFVRCSGVKCLAALAA